MCNCKKTKQVETIVITGTPEPIQIPEPPEEIDHFNNIDIIKPIQDGRVDGQAE